MEEERSRSGRKRAPPTSDIGIASKVKMSKLRNTPEPQNINFHSSTSASTPFHFWRKSVGH